MPDFVELEPEVVVSELPDPLVEPDVPEPDVPEPDADPDPVVSDELLVLPLGEPEPAVALPVVPGALPAVVPEPCLFGYAEAAEPVMPLESDPGVDRVVDDEEELPVSRPSVPPRSEQAPRLSVASAAATATPIARVFICFIFTPDSMLKVSPGPNARVPAPRWPSGRP